VTAGLDDGPDDRAAPWAPWWRVPALLAGAGALGWGMWLLLTGGRATAPLGTLTWMAGALLGHDAVVAPLAVAAGWVTVRLTARAPRDVRRVVAAGLFVATCLVAVAAAAILAPGIDNPTATPRDYGRGLATLLAIDAITVSLISAALGIRAARARRTGGRRRPTARRPASR
jgi:hypothetical protein